VIAAERREKMLTVLVGMLFFLTGFIFGVITFTCLYSLYAVIRKKESHFPPQLMFLVVTMISFVSLILSVSFETQTGQQLILLPFPLTREVSYSLGLGTGAFLPTWFFRRFERSLS
jgi:hypothetical protein